MLIPIKMQNYHIGIEGMAVRFSVGVMSDENGNIISAVRHEPISLHTIPEDVLIIRLNDIIKKLLLGAGLSKEVIPNTSICIGLTGTTYRYDREITLEKKILGKLKLNFKKTACTGDAEIAFLSCAQKKTGSIVVSHLGSTVLIVGEKNHKMDFKRVGGWGPIIGDDGSSYWMGLKVLKKLGNSYDQNRKLSPLWYETDKWLSNPEPFDFSWNKASFFWNEVKEAFQGTECEHIDPRTLLFYFAHHFNNRNDDINPQKDGFELWRNIIGGLLIPLMKAYEKDSIAKAIVDDAIKQLVIQHVSAFKNSNFKTYEPIVLFGGVFNHNPKFTELFKESMQREYKKKLEFINKETSSSMRPVCGALLYSLSNSNTQSLSFPNEICIKNVLISQLNPEFHKQLKNE